MDAFDANTMETDQLNRYLVVVKFIQYEQEHEKLNLVCTVIVKKMKFIKIDHILKKATALNELIK